MCNYNKDIDIHLKWPNDIYYSNTMKLGGVLVTSTMSSDVYECVAGILSLTLFNLNV